MSLENGLARAWPEGGPKVLWTVAVAEGFGGPAVYDGQVFLLDRVDNQQDLLRCLDLETGRELWRLAFDAPGRLPYDGSRNVPTVEEQYIFAVGPLGDFHCLNRRTHQVVWTRHLVNDFKDPEFDQDWPPQTREQQLARAQVPRWGFIQAPLLYGDTVIVAPETQKTGLVAYEKATGKIRWRSGYIGRNWYSHVSPCLATLCGVEQVLMLGQPSDPEKSPAQAPPAILSSTDPATGAILWTNATPGSDKIPIAEPLPVGTNRVFLTSGYGFGCAMVEISHTNGSWRSQVLFRHRTVASHIQSPVWYQGRIYVSSLKEQGGQNTGLVCLDQDGVSQWQTGPTLQFESGAFLIADGLALVMHGKTGYLHLFALEADAPQLLAKAKVLSARNGNVWAPLALSNGKLLVRDQHEMKCLDVRSHQ